MKRKLRWLAIVLAVLLLAFGTALFLWPRDRITEESWKMIRIGMTRAEVEHILGRSGMSYHDFVTQYNQFEEEMGFVDEGVRLEEPESFWPDDKNNARFWWGRGLLRIQFNEQGEVANKVFRAIRPAEPAFLDRLRDWLGW
jgi:hypothetical protein